MKSDPTFERYVDPSTGLTEVWLQRHFTGSVQTGWVVYDRRGAAPTYVYTATQEGFAAAKADFDGRVERLVSVAPLEVAPAPDAPQYYLIAADQYYGDTCIDILTFPTLDAAMRHLADKGVYLHGDAVLLYGSTVQLDEETLARYRKEAEDRRFQKDLAAREERERADYERLKRKFEG